MADDPRAYRAMGSPDAPGDSSGSSGQAQPPPSDDGPAGGSSGSGNGDSSTTAGESGVVSAGVSDGGIDITGGTDGGGDGLFSAHVDALNGVAGDTLDGVQVDALSSDSLVEARAPGLLDAEVGNGTVADVVDGATGATDDLGGLAGAFQGIEIDALDGTNIADVHAPGLAEATVGGAELGNLLDTGGGLLGGLTDDVGGAFQGIEVNALDGTNTADVNAPGLAEATVGGAELGNLIGGLDLPVDTGGGLVGDLLTIGSSGDLAGLDLGQTLDNVA